MNYKSLVPGDVKLTDAQSRELRRRAEPIPSNKRKVITALVDEGFLEALGGDQFAVTSAGKAWLFRNPT